MPLDSLPCLLYDCPEASPGYRAKVPTLRGNSMDNMSSNKEWDPESIAHAIDMELIPTEGEKALTHEDLAQRKLRESSAYAVDCILYLAMHGESEAMRFKASTYIVDQVLGRAGTEPLSTLEEKETILGDIMSVVSRTN